jgi:hypothetical protein
LCVCLIRCHDAVDVTATTLMHQRKCHFMRYVNTAPQEVSGFIYPSSSEQFSRPLPIALTGPKKTCINSDQDPHTLCTHQTIARSHSLLIQITQYVCSNQLLKPVLFTQYSAVLTLQYVVCVFMGVLGCAQTWTCA